MTTDLGRNAIQTLHDVVDLATRVRGTVGHVWWRGHGVAKWRLISGVHRAPERGSAFESATALKFMHRAPTRHLKCPALHERARWLFLMQHYRAPTRLLDWTESALVAIHFAVADATHDSTAGALWILNPYELNKLTIEERLLVDPTHSDVVRRIVDNAFEASAPRDDHTTVALITEEMDLRMLAQSACTTIHGSAKPLEAYSSIEQYLIKIPIPAKAKSVIRRQLLALGIRESQLFPDLEHLAAELSRFTYTDHEDSRAFPAVGEEGAS